MTRGVGIDTEGLKRLQVSLRAASRDVRREWRNGLKSVGETVANDARALAEPHSKKVAASIHVRTSGRAGVAIVAGGPQLPIAALMEGHGVPGSWRHPLFGNREHWYEQQRHPFMFPAYEAKKHEVGARLQTYVAKGIRHGGLRVE